MSEAFEELRQWVGRQRGRFFGYKMGLNWFALRSIGQFPSHTLRLFAYRKLFKLQVCYPVLSTGQKP
jgi:hypothetical protein